MDLLKINGFGFEEIADILNHFFHKYSTKSFIPNDPISIPHRFSEKKDIEIAGLFASIFAWGQRPTIIKKSLDLLQRMDNAPFQFVSQHKKSDIDRLSSFVHRTFNSDDLVFLIQRLKRLYLEYGSLESFFSQKVSEGDVNIEQGLISFHNYIFTPPNSLQRTKKHIASPARKSTCKRLNMYLRWMVRKDPTGVDFGIWEGINPKQLVCPVDLHVQRVGEALGLLDKNWKGWNLAVQLTENLKTFDSKDPVKYDIALFGMGVERIL